MKNIMPDWAKALTLYEVNIRQYTPEGTLKAFASHLPRLQELGAGILWLMPVQPIGKLNRKGSLGSYYSIQDYTAVNPDFGTLEDFKALVQEAHNSGMYVILDWVANHTAWDHHWREEHPDFYTRNEQGDFKSPVPDWEDVMELDYSNPDMRKAMQEAMRFWIQEANIDGFRCDMAHLVPTEFWEETREALRNEKELFMLAESQNRDLLHTAFQAEYSWELHHAINALANEKKNAHDLHAVVEQEIVHFPANAAPMLFTSNHDENSWNGSAPERLGFALEPLNVLTFTLNGIPLIYNGQEAGMSKKLSFFEKDEIPWKDDKMFPFYQTLVQLKKENPALWSPPYGGTFVKLNTEADDKIFAFARVKETDIVLVLLNLSYEQAEFSLRLDELQGGYRHVFTGNYVELKACQTMHLKPWNYLVYSSD